ncbi:unnamed protein product [Jaminaea pallidilutea]
MALTRSTSKLDFSPTSLGPLDTVALVASILWKMVVVALGFGPQWALDGGETVQIPRLSVRCPIVLGPRDLQAFEDIVQDMQRQPNSDGKVDHPPQTSSTLALVAPTNPLMILLLAHQRCPLLPIGALHVRNRFEIVDAMAMAAVAGDRTAVTQAAASRTPGSASSQTPGSASSQTPGSASSQTPGSASSQTPGSASSQTSGTASSQTPGSASSQTPGSASSQTSGTASSQTSGSAATWICEASIAETARRARKGIEVDIVLRVDDASGLTVFRQTITVLQLSRRLALKDKGAAKASDSDWTQCEHWATLELTKSLPHRWAAISKDYNPIHTSSLLAKYVFGLGGAIAHGNCVAVGCFAGYQGQQLAQGEPWALEISFRKPMVLPLKLQIERARGDRRDDVMERNGGRDRNDGTERDSKGFAWRAVGASDQAVYVEGRWWPERGG